nr:Meckel syndrome type 1 protein [Megalopta genalis]
MLTKIRKEKISSSYRVNESINNFKIRVKIVQQRPLLAELLEDEEDTRDSNFVQEEDYIFDWQEKVFSPFEVDFYKDEKNCTTETQKSYCRKINEESVKGSHLYTYTQTDSYYSENELLTRPYKSKLACRNGTALPSLQNRKPFTERYNKSVIDDKPGEARIRANHYVYMERSTMYVMVDLSRRDKAVSNPDKDSETVLCVIAYDRLHKTLSVNPDFTNDRPYVVTNSSGVEFNYWIEHTSEEQTPEELQEERNELQRESKERLMYKEAEISPSFELTTPQIHKVFVKLDILSAHEFIFDGLCVSYYIQLPEDWSTDQSDRLFGRTQRCNLKNKSAYFGYATEISLDFKSDNALTAKKTLPFWPRFLLLVTSLDTWSRYRTEGYAVIALPAHPGTYEFSIPTWRPTGSIINSLRRYFTGGTYELNDITYCNISARYEDKLLNKSHVKVTSNGCVKLKMNIIYQIHTSTRIDDQHDYFQNLTTDKLMTNIENIFEQFRAARDRMMQVKRLNI